MPVQEIDYRGCGIAVRDDIVASQNRAWRSLAAAGTWWTGQERVDIAREVRAASRCTLCRGRKAALSPYAVAGAHDSVTKLPAAVVDAVHRVVTDPGRLSRRWADEAMASGISDAHLVELISVVCTVMLVDGFARTIGAAQAPLPQPQAGKPSRGRPREAVDEGYFVPTVPFEAGKRPEFDLFDDAPFMPNVGRGLSLVPDATRSAKDLMLAHYMPYHQVVTDFEPPGRPISRSQIELVAARVSAKNGCFY